MAFGHFLLDSHNYIVTALGSCVKWPLDYNEDVHQSRQLGEWSNMIGYKMGSSLVGILSTTKTSLVENLQAWMKKWHGCQHNFFFFYWFAHESSPKVRCFE